MGWHVARVCVVCGASLAARRRHARYCSGSCRAEASRLRRILGGSQPDGFASVASRIGAMSRNRTDPP